MPIRLLTPDVAALIAAGEVVQRPASVVKELIDNALDAGAERIHVVIERGGTGRITVSDDGCGMAREDARLCLEKHATSKIRDARDLQRILTLGFRGEALAAIAAVAQVEITTRRREDPVGTRLVSAKTGRRIEDAGCPAGTCVDVRNLFENVPARRKFLKNETTEFKHCTEAVVRAALVSESVHITLDHGSRRTLDLPRCGSRAERVHTLLGRDVFEQLYPLAGERDGIQVTGWVSAPTLCRNNSQQVYIFVNDRYVQNRTLQAALMESYRNVLPKGRFPVAVLFVELDPVRVDINVHPSKMEIRLDDESSAFRAVHSAVHEALTTGGRGTDLGLSLHLPRPSTNKKPDTPLLPASSAPSLQVPMVGHRPSPEHTRSLLESLLAAPPAAGEPDRVPIPPTGVAHEVSQPLLPTTDVARAPAPSPPSRPPFVPRAYVLGLYLIAESSDTLMLLDTHAAHERIVYERLKRLLANHRMESQTLLFPLQVELGPHEVQTLEANTERLEELGFATAPFGERTVLVSAIPAHTTVEQCNRLLHDLLADFEQVGGRHSMEDLQHQLLITMACHSAHRAGERLDPADMQALLEEYFATPQHETCPHGRPTALYWRREELGRLFGRS